VRGGDDPGLLAESDANGSEESGNGRNENQIGEGFKHSNTSYAIQELEVGNW
jgi:hypothetical protein